MTGKTTRFVGLLLTKPPETHDVKVGGLTDVTGRPFKRAEKHKARVPKKTNEIDWTTIYQRRVGKSIRIHIKRKNLKLTT